MNQLENIISKKVLFIDTETTGLPNGELKSGNREDRYPDYKSTNYDNSRLVQIAWGYYDKFNYSVSINIFNISDILVKPYNFVVTNSKFHGITNELAKEKGKNIDEVLNIIGKYIIDCDYIIGYNIYFDFYILLNELYRLKMQTRINKLLKMKENKKILCIGELSRIYTGKALYMPKQTDVYKSIFKKALDNAHNAKYDIYATIKIMCHFYDKNVSKTSENITINKSEKVIVRKINDVKCIKKDNKYYLYENKKKGELYAIINENGDIELTD